MTTKQQEGRNVQFRVDDNEMAMLDDLVRDAAKAGVVNPKRGKTAVLRALIRTADFDAVAREVAQVRPISWAS